MSERIEMYVRDQQFFCRECDANLTMGTHLGTCSHSAMHGGGLPMSDTDIIREAIDAAAECIASERSGSPKERDGIEAERVARHAALTALEKDRDDLLRLLSDTRNGEQDSA